MIAAALAEQGVDVPRELLSPDVWPVAESYRVAFHVLSESRGKSMNGFQAIKYTEIVKYAEKNGYADTMDELEEFVSLIQAQDGAFLVESAKQAARTT